MPTAFPTHDFRQYQKQNTARVASQHRICEAMQAALPLLDAAKLPSASVPQKGHGCTILYIYIYIYMQHVPYDMLNPTSPVRTKLELAMQTNRLQ